MNRTIRITIRDKIAKADKTLYICGNSDFVIHFDFDDEWAEHDAKTARFISGDGKYQDVVFRGTECPMPVISDTYMIKVGVYAGDLHTTTPAIVSAKKSILCESGVPADPAPDVYSQIMEKINAGMLRGEQGEQGIPGPAGPAGEPGKDAEPYTLPVASADTLGGVKVGAGLQMDGDALGVKPESLYELIDTITLNGETAVELTQEPDGTPYNFSDIIVEIETSKNSTVAGHVYPNILMGSVAAAAYGLASGIAVGSKRFMATGVSITKGIAESFATSVGHDSSSATTLYRRPVTAFADRFVDKVLITASVPFPEGTLVRIKAVRADA